MLDFVELWVYLASTPLFGLAATVVVYVLAQAVYTALGQAPWANPVLWSVVCIAAVLLVSGVQYPVYFAGAQFIHVLLGPAVVALAWPMWQRKDALVRFGRGSMLVSAICVRSSCLSMVVTSPVLSDQRLDLGPVHNKFTRLTG